MAHLKRCNKCGNRCCRYVAIEIDTPRTDEDFDDIRWYVAHRKVTVFKHDGEWHFNVNTKCKQLDKDGRCKMYDKRPRICREYELDECEEDGLDYEVNLCTVKRAAAMPAHVGSVSSDGVHGFRAGRHPRGGEDARGARGPRRIRAQLQTKQVFRHRAAANVPRADKED